MKKGKIRIGLGIALIILQLMSLMGNAGIGIQLSFASMAAFAYSMAFLVSYFLVGIIGTILLISGLVAYSKK